MIFELELLNIIITRTKKPVKKSAMQQAFEDMGKSVSQFYRDQRKLRQLENNIIYLH